MSAYAIYLSLFQSLGAIAFSQPSSSMMWGRTKVERPGLLSSNQGGYVACCQRPCCTAPENCKATYYFAKICTTSVDIQYYRICCIKNIDICLYIFFVIRYNVILYVFIPSRRTLRRISNITSPLRSFLWPKLLFDL